MEQTVDVPVPQAIEEIEIKYAPVTEYVAPTPAVSCAAPAPVNDRVATPKSVGVDWPPGTARYSVKSESDFAKSSDETGSSWTRANGTTSAAATAVVKSAAEARFGTAKYRITTKSEHADYSGAGIAECSAKTVQDLIAEADVKAYR